MTSAARYSLLDTRRGEWTADGLTLVLEVSQSDDTIDVLVVECVYDGRSVECAATCRVIRDDGSLVGEGKTPADLRDWVESSIEVRRAAMVQRDEADECESWTVGG